ncbi:hypothetical protein VOLCADRAFT_95253 [Volvox carteri f. nagariensis]|uniref:Uncharacterized protein n=1 Tax=Volvox carteri f. nagariensis TaxID=3068 RepID=D8U706_VOLCA|nr:uncharacterized protein VOLCADRAFT_95253 [Volvox carteri f. nagariensis]EFJ44531.1 hypothetical protein VOLCADRAFT_95253 [Volvox carteri f. nagariensis]|eukprot:XP_002954381.1 hypothetical protein VOLCADRAFT_95253 [Volvox carteri f. nagariensis]
MCTRAHKDATRKDPQQLAEETATVGVTGPCSCTSGAPPAEALEERTHTYTHTYTRTDPGTPKIPKRVDDLSAVAAPESMSARAAAVASSAARAVEPDSEPEPEAIIPRVALLFLVQGDGPLANEALWIAFLQSAASLELRRPPPVAAVRRAAAVDLQALVGGALKPPLRQYDEAAYSGYAQQHLLPIEPEPGDEPPQLLHTPRPSPQPSDGGIRAPPAAAPLAPDAASASASAPAVRAALLDAALVAVSQRLVAELFPRPWCRDAASAAANVTGSSSSGNPIGGNASSAVAMKSCIRGGGGGGGGDAGAVSGMRNGCECSGVSSSSNSINNLPLSNNRNRGCGGCGCNRGVGFPEGSTATGTQEPSAAPKPSAAVHQATASWAEVNVLRLLRKAVRQRIDVMRASGRSVEGGWIQPRLERWQRWLLGWGWWRRRRRQMPWNAVDAAAAESSYLIAQAERDVRQLLALPSAPADAASSAAASNTVIGRQPRVRGESGRWWWLRWLWMPGGGTAAKSGEEEEEEEEARKLEEMWTAWSCGSTPDSGIATSEDVGLLSQAVLVRGANTTRGYAQHVLIHAELLLISAALRDSLTVRLVLLSETSIPVRLIWEQRSRVDACLDVDIELSRWHASMATPHLRREHWRKSSQAAAEDPFPPPPPSPLLLQQLRVIKMTLLPLLLQQMTLQLQQVTPTGMLQQVLDGHVQRAASRPVMPAAARVMKALTGVEAEAETDCLGEAHFADWTSGGGWHPRSFQPTDIRQLAADLVASKSTGGRGGVGAARVKGVRGWRRHRQQQLWRGLDWLWQLLALPAAPAVVGVGVVAPADEPPPLPDGHRLWGPDEGCWIKHHHDDDIGGGSSGAEGGDGGGGYGGSSGRGASASLKSLGRVFAVQLGQRPPSKPWSPPVPAGATVAAGGGGAVEATAGTDAGAVSDVEAPTLRAWLEGLGYVPLGYRCHLFARKFPPESARSALHFALACPPRGLGLGAWCFRRSWRPSQREVDLLYKV